MLVSFHLCYDCYLMLSLTERVNRIVDVTQLLNIVIKKKLVRSKKYKCLKKLHHYKCYNFLLYGFDIKHD